MEGKRGLCEGDESVVMASERKRMEVFEMGSLRSACDLRFRGRERERERVRCKSSSSVRVCDELVLCPWK